MERIRVLLADGNAEGLSAMGDYLQRRSELEVVGRVSDGAEVVTAALSLFPDVLVMDLILPRRDGFQILEQLSSLSAENRPKVIVLTGLIKDEFILRAVNLGASYYMVKPFDLSLLASRILEIAGGGSLISAPEEALSPESEEADAGVTNLFLTLGIPAHIKGYRYLREAVLMVLENHSVINRITKELYPGVAKKCATTPSKVERAMRHAIEVAWNRGRLDSANRMYGYRFFDQQDKPSNGEFIAMIADSLSLPHKQAL